MTTETEYLHLIKRLKKADTLEREGIVGRIQRETITPTDALALLNAIEAYYREEAGNEAVSDILEGLEVFANNKSHMNVEIETVSSKERPEESRFSGNTAKRGTGRRTYSSKLGEAFILNNTAFVEISLKQKFVAEPAPNPKNSPVPRKYFADAQINIETFDFGNLLNYTPSIVDNYVYLPVIHKNLMGFTELYFDTAWYFSSVWSVIERDNYTIATNTLINRDNPKNGYYLIAAFQMQEKEVVPVPIFLKEE